MTKQLYTTQLTVSTIPIGRALWQAILVVCNQSSLNQLDREVFIVRNDFRVILLNLIFCEIIFVVSNKKDLSLNEGSKSNLGWICWYLNTRLV